MTSLEDTLITHELATRASRAPDFEAENRALGRLAHALDLAPEAMLATLAQTSLEMCRGESAGISILEHDVVLRWHAVTGRWAHLVNGEMPRAASPCGTVLDRGALLLFADPGRQFPEMARLDPLAAEALLAPFHCGGVAVGSVWVVTHTLGRTFDAEDARMLKSLSGFAAAAYQVQQRRRAEDAHDRSTVAFRTKLQRMSFEATAAQERDRRRIAVELHDRIGQSLALAQIMLTTISDASSADARAAITEAIELIKQSVLDTRSLTFELSPPILYDLGLGAAIAWHAEQIEVSRGQRVEVHETGEAIVLDDTTAAVVFRTVRELLMNVFKHAQTLTAQVWLRRTGDWLHVTVEDTGVGFDARPDAIVASGSFGLFSVREQIGRLGGTVEIVSSKGQGTSVHVQVPLEPPLPEHG